MYHCMLPICFNVWPTTYATMRPSMHATICIVTYPDKCLATYVPQGVLGATTVLPCDVLTVFICTIV